MTADAAQLFKLITTSFLVGCLCGPVGAATAAPMSTATPAPTHASREKKPVLTDKDEKANSAANGNGKLETYRDLIAKAQNLTLQRDRLQASQVLIRGLQREAPNSLGHRELARTLDELTTVFYTEKAQGMFSSAESLAEVQPHDALEPLQQALRIEDSNLTLLKALARLYLRLAECDKADATVTLAENVNPFAAEVKLLRLQTLNCQKNYELLSATLMDSATDLKPVAPFLHSFEIEGWLRKKEFKKAKAVLALWEGESPLYPEIYYWKWRLSEAQLAVDRSAALRYFQLCQALTVRKRKSFNLDVDLCKGKEAADLLLKESAQPTAPTPEAQK